MDQIVFQTYIIWRASPQAGDKEKTRQIGSSSL